MFCLFGCFLLCTASFPSRLPLVSPQASVAEGANTRSPTLRNTTAALLKNFFAGTSRTLQNTIPPFFIILRAGKEEEKNRTRRTRRRRQSANVRASFLEVPPPPPGRMQCSPPRWQKPLRSPINYLKGRCETQPLHLPPVAQPLNAPRGLFQDVPAAAGQEGGDIFRRKIYSRTRRRRHWESLGCQLSQWGSFNS